MRVSSNSCAEPNIPLRYPCPCCGYLTFNREPGSTFELCPVCFWQDDPVQFEDHDSERGANRVSLNMARLHFREFGASEKEFLELVRPPWPEEMPPMCDPEKIDQ